MLHTALQFLLVADRQPDIFTVPHEDETSLVRVKVEPAAYVDTPLTICGAVRISDYYDFG